MASIARRFVALRPHRADACRDSLASPVRAAGRASIRSYVGPAKICPEYRFRVDDVRRVFPPKCSAQFASSASRCQTFRGGQRRRRLNIDKRQFGFPHVRDLRNFPSPSNSRLRIVDRTSSRMRFWLCRTASTRAFDGGDVAEHARDVCSVVRTPSDFVRDIVSASRIKRQWRRPERSRVHV